MYRNAGAHDVECACVQSEQSKPLRSTGAVKAEWHTVPQFVQIDVGSAQAESERSRSVVGELQRAEDLEKRAEVTLGVCLPREKERKRELGLLEDDTFFIGWAPATKQWKAGLQESWLLKKRKL